MLTTEHPWNSTVETKTKSPPPYELRLHVGTEDQRLVAIPWGKHSIGSGPRCSLRLEYPGVQPLECLIVHEESGLRVRRWCENTTLNGQSFDDSRLTTGDVLTVGPVELEVTSPQVEAAPTNYPWSATEAWESESTPSDRETAGFDDDESHDLPSEEVAQTEGVATASVTDCSAEHAFELSPQVLQPTGPQLGWESSEPVEMDSANESAVPNTSASAGVAATEGEAAPTDGERPSRRVQVALRRQRKQYDQLVARVEDLERKIEQALTEPPAAVDQQANSDEASVEESAAIERRRRQENLESQLTQVREQLSARDRELNQARYSIDVLERQLIDSQRTMHAFAEERLRWEGQFNELEARLADYVERIQELERQLENVRACQTEAAPLAVAPSVEWATETPADQSTSIDEVVAETVTDSADDTSIAALTTWHDTVEEPAAEEIAPIAVADVAPPSDPAEAENSVDESPDVDAALDHLRGLALWREEPQIASESNVEAEPPATDDTPSSAAHFEPASFIDRYAHLFPNDDTPADSLPKPVEPLRRVPPPVHETASSPVADGSENEESVEQYMAKLLERMRGPANTDMPVTEDAPATDQSSEANASASAPDEATAAVHEPITDLAELKTKPTVAEQASHRQAMRELAMQSARHAIGVHASRKLRRSARTRSIIAVLGAAVAAYLLITAPGWKSLQFAAACVAGFVALYWGKMTLSTILEGIRLGAFEDYDDEVDADKAIHPPLPIDVEPATPSESDSTIETVEREQSGPNSEVVEHAEQESSSEPVEHTVHD